MTFCTHGLNHVLKSSFKIGVLYQAACVLGKISISRACRHRIFGAQATFPCCNLFYIVSWNTIRLTMLWKFEAHLYKTTVFPSLIEKQLWLLAYRENEFPSYRCLFIAQTCHFIIIKFTKSFSKVINNIVLTAALFYLGDTGELCVFWCWMADLNTSFIKLQFIVHQGQQLS